MLLYFVSQGYNNSKGVALEASFTPDSQFIMIGKSKTCFLMSDGACQMYSYFSLCMIQVPPLPVFDLPYRLYSS
jgi:hypothetical protein